MAGRPICVLMIPIRSKEDIEFVESIQQDVQWLGFQWDGDVLYASDYFEQLYEFAVELIQFGQGVCR